MPKDGTEDLEVREYCNNVPVAGRWVLKQVLYTVPVARAVMSWNLNHVYMSDVNNSRKVSVHF